MTPLPVSPVALQSRARSGGLVSGTLGADSSRPVRGRGMTGSQSQGFPMAAGCLLSPSGLRLLLPQPPGGAAPRGTDPART